MPQIPTYSSKVPIAGGVPVTRVDTSTQRQTAEIVSRDLQRVSDGFAQIAERQQQMAQAQKATELSLAGQQQLAELRQRFETDTSPDAGQRFEAEAVGLRERLLAGTEDRDIQNLVGRDFDRATVVGSVEVRRNGFVRQRQEGVARLDNQISDYAQLAAQARTPQERELVLGGARSAIAGAAASGLIDPVTAAKRERDLLGRVDQVAAIDLMGRNPDQAATALADPKQFTNLDPLVRERLQAQAAARSDATFNRNEVRERREKEELSQRLLIQFDERFRAGDTAGAAETVSQLRGLGLHGAYASAADRLYGQREIPTTPQMESWVEDRLRDRARPLTREELEQARSGRQINDTVYRNGLSRLAGREDAVFREAEQFVERSLQVPSGAIADRDLQPWQREAKNQANGIINDLVIARRDNPSIDALGFVRERLRQGNPAQVVEQRRNTAAADRIPAEFRTPEGFAQLQQQMTAWQAYRNLGWLARQGAETVEQPRANIMGQRVVISLDEMNRWKKILEGAGILQQQQGGQP